MFPCLILIIYSSCFISWIQVHFSHFVAAPCLVKLHCICSYILTRFLCPLRMWSRLLLFLVKVHNFKLFVTEYPLVSHNVRMHLSFICQAVMDLLRTAWCTCNQTDRWWWWTAQNGSQYMTWFWQENACPFSMHICKGGNKRD